ncbi:hypothetical protein PM082_004752 [Marasmius tenuissimus]|nr:hypothetical protein PM082_004752 [Marasmius tenuissimus]
MRCAWFTKASRVSHSLAHAHSQKSSLKYLLPAKSPFFASNHQSNYTSLPPKLPASLAYISTATSYIPRPAPSPQNQFGSDAEDVISAAQTSRAAWKAVRVSMQAGDLASATLVLNSARHSQPTHRKNRSSAVIDFNVPISPRLCAHALLHGLIRLGMNQKAYRLAQHLMADGVRVHPKTLESLVHGVLDSSGKPSSINGELFIRWKALLPTHSVLYLSPAVSSDPSIRCAIQILQAAREHNRQHSERMFSAVIKACLLHGELLAASLIFTAIVKAWTLKDSVPVHVSQTTDGQPTISGPQAPTSPLYRSHLRPALMLSIVSSILEIIDRDGMHSDDGVFEVAFQAALQALANLACLLDLRQLPFGNVASLVRALYSCPKVDNKVWILDYHGKRQHVRAYDYFHGVLEHLAKHPPRHLDSEKFPPRRRTWTPILDMDSCNSLLHYSLRHRLSAELSQNVVHYINQYHTPNTTTINILLTSGRLLRISGLAENALTHLHMRVGDDEKPLPIPLIDTPKIAMNSHSEAIREVEAECLDKHLTSSVQSSLAADAYSLSAYITYLVSTGRADTVAAILFDLLPELSIVDHPSWGSANPRLVKLLCAESREACIRRVVPYGPYLFVALLNALRKAGQVGLAERVWMLAKLAERASWDKAMRGNSGPWLLPVHAYTIMIQCYGRQVIQGPLAVASSEKWWRPSSDTRLRGWAKLVLSSPKRRNKSPSSKTVSVYNSMMVGAREVYRELTRLHAPMHIPRSVEIPKPDARFFNAMLNATTRHSQMCRRRARTSPSHWKQHVGFARWLYAKLGTPVRHPNVYLEEITLDMMKHGLPLPVGLKYLLVGRHSIAMGRYQPTFVGLDKRPYAYPRLPTKTSPFTLPTTKTKGLPLQRRHRVTSGFKNRRTRRESRAL